MRRFLVLACFAASGFGSLVDGGPVSPQVCIDGTGNAVAIWSETAAQGVVVSAASHPKNGNWGVKQTLSAEGENAFSPKVATNADGHLFAIWRGHASSFVANTIQVSEADFGESWSSPAVLVSTTSNLLYPTIKVNASEDAIAMWGSLNSSSGLYSIQSSSLFAPSGSWTDPDTLSFNRLFSFPDLALDNNGLSLTIWSKNARAMNSVVSSKGTGGVWADEEILSDVSLSQGNPRPYTVLNNALDGTRGAAVWSGTRDDHDFIQVRFYLGGDLWTNIMNVSDAGFVVAQPVIDVSDQGHAVVAWQATSDRANWIIQGVFYDPQSGWGSIQTLSSSNAQNPRVAMNADGDAIVAWEINSGASSVIQALSVASDGTWGNAETISNEGQNSINVEIGLNDLLDAVAVWRASPGGVNEIQAAVSIEGGEWGSPTTISD